jgi:SH3-like domain-containing protein
MKFKVFAHWSLIAALAGFPLMAGAAPSKARVKADRTNVRSKPSSDGEVLISLRKDEVVEVIEEVEGPGADGKPRPWSKISLPSRVALWIYGPLLDPKSKTIKTESVHLRTGPGKNYSELGELPRGTKVTVVRELEDWFQVEPPKGLTAFVASSLLSPGEGATPAKTKIPEAAVKAAEQQQPTQVQIDDPATIASAGRPARPGAIKNRVYKPEQSEQTTVPMVPLVAANPVDPAGASGTTAPPADTTISQPSVPAPVEVPTTTSTVPWTTSQPTAPILIPGDPSVPREVTREGMLRRAWNIQAPGYFELRSSLGEGLLNYLVSESTNVDLKTYLGRPVIVSGTEWRDKRWRTPLIKVTDVKLAQ